MKSLQTSLLFAFGVALAAPVLAQSDGYSSGLLGKRYVEASGILFNYAHSSDDSYTVGTDINIPLAAHLDLGASLTQSWLEGDQGENFQDLAVALTAYTAWGDFKPFAKASLGYEWWHVSNDPFYQIDVGGEYRLTNRFSVSVQGTWIEYLADDWNGGSFSASARANYWFTERLAASVSLVSGEGGTWGYGLGALLRF